MSEYASNWSHGAIAGKTRYARTAVRPITPDPKGLRSEFSTQYVSRMQRRPPPSGSALLAMAEELDASSFLPLTLHGWSGLQILGTMSRHPDELSVVHFLPGTDAARFVREGLNNPVEVFVKKLSPYPYRLSRFESTPRDDIEVTINDRVLRFRSALEAGRLVSVGVEDDRGLSIKVAWGDPSETPQAVKLVTGISLTELLRARNQLIAAVRRER